MHKHFCVDLDSGGTATTYMYDSRATAGALRGEARGVQARSEEEGSACGATVHGRRQREPPAQGADRSGSHPAQFRAVLARVPARRLCRSNTARLGARREPPRAHVVSSSFRLCLVFVSSSFRHRFVLGSSSRLCFVWRFAAAEELRYSSADRAFAYEDAFGSSDSSNSSAAAEARFAELAGEKRGMDFRRCPRSEVPDATAEIAALLRQPPRTAAVPPTIM